MRGDRWTAEKLRELRSFLVSLRDEGHICSMQSTARLLLALNTYPIYARILTALERFYKGFCAHLLVLHGLNSLKKVLKDTRC